MIPGKIQRTKEGYVRVWRICANPKANDFNREPNNIVVPYAIIDERNRAYNVVRMGWGFSKKRQRCLPKHEFYFSKEEAEEAIKNGNV